VSGSFALRRKQALVSRRKLVPVPQSWSAHVTDGRGCLVLGLRVSVLGVSEVMVVRVFVAGGSGVVGRQLVSQLVARGHQVTATTTGSARLGLLKELGADGVVMDGLDAASVGEAVARAAPEVIVNEMTALSEQHAGKPNMRKPERYFGITGRLRSEGTDHLLAAAEATGVSRLVAQSGAARAAMARASSSMQSSP
jgi:UDP-glucose 4-epimerase